MTDLVSREFSFMSVELMQLGAGHEAVRTVEGLKNNDMLMPYSFFFCSIIYLKEITKCYW